MDELLAKDLSFFQNNYAGSLTKRALGYARRFEDVFDVLTFQVAATMLPLGFVGVVLWSYSPWLIAVLLTMLAATLAMVLPLIRRRRRLVDVREVASNKLAGHVADSIANAEAVRAFAREPDEARIHADNVIDYGAKTQRSWDYQNLRVDMVAAPMFVVTNTLGLVVALATSGGSGAEPRGGVHHVQLLRHRDARDVGVQPDLPQPRRRVDRCGAVRRASARSACGRGRGHHGAVHARRVQRRAPRRELSLLARSSRCCSTGSRCGSRPARRSGSWADRAAARQR